MSKTNISRRVFLMQTVATGAAVSLATLSGSAFAANPMLTEADPSAKALGYVTDATKTKDPKHLAGQQCSGCNFYKGAGKTGACALFPGKDVAATGWCKSFVKKAA